MNPKLERVKEISTTELGEGPHWDAETQSLYLVDIFGQAIHRYVPATRQHTKVVLERSKVPSDAAYKRKNLVSLVLPVKGQKDRFVVGLDRELLAVTWDGVSDKVTNIEKIVEVQTENELVNNRFNDGKCDPSGRIWAGTMGEEPTNGNVAPGRGSLFSIQNGKAVKHLGQLGISNGLAWNEQLKKMYYIDSFKRCIEEYDFDIQNGTISNGKSIFSLEKNNVVGFPDGMTIDVDGNLWVAVFGGYKVIKIDPRKPETLLATIPIPAKEVTSVTFGGPNLDELYVTSANFTINGEVLPPPEHGGTYKVTGLNTKGYAGVLVSFQLSSPFLRLEEISTTELGEGPHWDAETQSLYFVDLFGQAIHRYVPATRQHTKAVLDTFTVLTEADYRNSFTGDRLIQGPKRSGKNVVSLILPVKGQKDRFVVSVNRTLVIVTWDGVSDIVTNVEKIIEVDTETELINNRFNDGKCDPSGRIWAGTIGEDPSNINVAGSLFSIEYGRAVKHLRQVQISNGLAWNEHLQKMYYIDTFKRSVYEFDFDIINGRIYNGQTIFNLTKHNIEGFPDGMTIDVDGNLWVAVFSGYRVIKIDPRQPETLLDTIPIPAKQISSVAFGGPNLDELYVTSGTFTTDGEVLSSPEHGGTYRVTGLNTRGYPGVSAVL
ncbi:uncharacterized protein LOC114340496 [Diabrotica virgifera virgifera]|uniref:Regucalcin n=1 Tax=Diabrotica virgifera virgifera TaxID=50390 RepID=A0A6P7GCE8_DIAVI|nr:uncharacterized protein LOC114340496 [Diabrotica virgifera virgifera]